MTTQRPLKVCLRKPLGRQMAACITGEKDFRRSVAIRREGILKYAPAEIEDLFQAVGMDENPHESVRILFDDVYEFISGRSVEIAHQLKMESVAAVVHQYLEIRRHGLLLLFPWAINAYWFRERRSSPARVGSLCRWMPVTVSLWEGEDKVRSPGLGFAPNLSAMLVYDLLDEVQPQARAVGFCPLILFNPAELREEPAIELVWNRTPGVVYVEF